MCEALREKIREKITMYIKGELQGYVLKASESWTDDTIRPYVYLMSSDDDTDNRFCVFTGSGTAGKSDLSIFIPWVLKLNKDTVF